MGTLSYAKKKSLALKLRRQGEHVEFKLPKKNLLCMVDTQNTPNLQKLEIRGSTDSAKKSVKGGLNQGLIGVK